MSRHTMTAALVALALFGSALGAPGATAARKKRPCTAKRAPAPDANAPVAAGDAGSLADQLVAAETGLRTDGATADERTRNGRTTQVAYRALTAHPDWMPVVLDRAPEELRQVIQANVDAGRELRSMHTKLKSTLPCWRIVKPAPAGELLAHYRKAEATYGVPWTYLAAIHLVETRMGRIRGVSTAGAMGPMQFMPPTWKAYGSGNINSNHDSIMAAARYLKRNGAPRRMDNAVWNYNHTWPYVRAVTAYARQMQADERAYHGYHAWQVVYLTDKGDVLLPEGWSA